MHGGGNHAVDGRSQAQSQPSAEDVRAQLARLLASPDFDVPDRLRKFLRYIVEETLAGRAQRIKAYSVGTEVFKRDPSFDAQSDPVVRIEAGRLRRALDHYYLVSGVADPVVIEIPKGGSVPHFASRVAPVLERPSTIAPPLATTSLATLHSWRWPTRPALWWGSGLLVLAAMVLAATMFLAQDALPPGTAEGAASAPPGGPTLVVLPFASLGGLPDAEFYAAGLTEEILGQLARFKELVILGRETARSIPQGADAAWIRRELGARYVLEGSVQTVEHRLRVAGRLLDAESGAVLWSQTYDDDLQVRDLFAIQGDVARQVATAVGQPYGIIFRADERRVAALPPDDLEAYACTLQFYGYRAALSAASHAAIRGCLERAVARYPSYATAWAMLSILYLDEDRFGFNRQPESPAETQRAVEAARRAARLDPENVRALQALMMALFFTEQPTEALEVGERALALNPNDTELLGDFGSRVGQSGDHARGVALLEQALARNPGHSDYYNGTLAHLAYLQRDYRRAAALIQHVSLDKFPLYHFVAALIYAQLDMAAEAATAREQFLRMRPSFFDHWDDEVVKRNFRPEDGALLAQGARKAGFPVPALTASERVLQMGAAQP
jgi:adenylate cyclase